MRRRYCQANTVRSRTRTGKGTSASMDFRSSGVASSSRAPNINGSWALRHLLGAVLAETVPLLLGDAAGGDRQDVLLLVVEMLQQGDPERVEGRSHLLADRGSGLGLPAGERFGELVDQLVDAVMLRFHPVNQLGVGRVPLEQLRPEQHVLAGVMHIQAGQHQPGVLAHDGGSGGVAGRDLADQLGDQDELATEDAMDDVHVTDIGELLSGIGGGGHVLQPAGRAGGATATRPPHSAHS